MLNVLLNPPEGRPRTRLNTSDRAGNTPLHLAMESGHGEAAVVLIEAGADRERVSLGLVAERDFSRNQELFDCLGPDS